MNFNDESQNIESWAHMTDWLSIVSQKESTVLAKEILPTVHAQTRYVSELLAKLVFESKNNQDSQLVAQISAHHRRATLLKSQWGSYLKSLHQFDDEVFEEKRAIEREKTMLTEFLELVNQVEKWKPNCLDMISVEQPMPFFIDDAFGRNSSFDIFDDIEEAAEGVVTVLLSLKEKSPETYQSFVKALEHAKEGQYDSLHTLLARTDIKDMLKSHDQNEIFDQIAQRLDEIKSVPPRMKDADEVSSRAFMHAREFALKALCTSILQLLPGKPVQNQSQEGDELETTLKRGISSQGS